MQKIKCSIQKPNFVYCNYLQSYNDGRNVKNYRKFGSE